MLANPPLDIQVHDSYFVVAHFHYVLVGGALIGLFAGLYFYFPKVTGRMLDEGLGKWHFWLFTIGLNLTFFPMHMLGTEGMPRRIYTYPMDAGWNTYNFIATIGVFFMVASTAILAHNVGKSLKHGKRAGNDPWDANTLEWMTTSPPQEYNFTFTPQVRSERPLWDHKHVEGMQIIPPTEPEEFHMPSGSWKPMIASGCVALLLTGLLLSSVIGAPGFVMMVAGGLGVVASIWAWLHEPV
jgi:cytochrome c oxidase subunit 1